MKRSPLFLAIPLTFLFTYKTFAQSSIGSSSSPASTSSAKTTTQVMPTPTPTPKPTPAPTPSPTPTPTPTPEVCEDKCNVAVLPYIPCSGIGEPGVNEKDEEQGADTGGGASDEQDGEKATCDGGTKVQELSFSFDPKLGKILNAKALFGDGSCTGAINMKTTVPGAELQSNRINCDKANVCGDPVAVPFRSGAFVDLIAKWKLSFDGDVSEQWVEPTEIVATPPIVDGENLPDGTIRKFTLDFTLSRSLELKDNTFSFKSKDIYPAGCNSKLWDVSDRGTSFEDVVAEMNQRFEIEARKDAARRSWIISKEVHESMLSGVANTEYTTHFRARIFGEDVGFGVFDNKIYGDGPIQPQSDGVGLYIEIKPATAARVLIAGGEGAIAGGKAIGEGIGEGCAYAADGVMYCADKVGDAAVWCGGKIADGASWCGGKIGDLVDAVGGWFDN